MAKCRVKVLKQFYDEDLAKKYLVNSDNLYPCRFFPEMGVSWIIDANCEMPEGFCRSAWASIERNVFTFTRGGGNIAGSKWMKDENKMLTCCTDAVRPVVFLLERIDT